MSDRAPANGHSADAVINRVLAAEGEARAAVEHCRQQAADLITRAEVQARAAGSRAERRIRLAQRIADRGIESALADLRDSDGTDATIATPDLARLDAVIEVLAAELSGSGA